MSAIAGRIGKYPTDIQAVLSAMEKMGPDQKGAYFGDGCCFLHTRLMVTDPECGKQPMEIYFGGERYIGICSGNIYNCGELMTELSALGHSLEEKSTICVLIHAYAQWGAECLSHFNGVFGFAIWAQKKQELFLARDPMGVEPLFYKIHDSSFLFGSRIKQILAFPQVKPELDQEGVLELVMLGPGRKPGSGVFYGIRELEPGCCGTFCRGKWNCRRYWKLRDREHREDFQETAEHVRYLVEDAAFRQMSAGVKVGCFLSGGLDSSILSAICAHRQEETGDKLSTFSLSIENNDRFFTPGKFQPTSDTEFVNAMVAALDTDHHVLSQTCLQQAEALQDAVLARDLPGMGDVDSSMLLLCRQVREHRKVVLSGECADEIFGGYPWYRDPAVRHIDGFPWAQNTSVRKKLLNPDVEAYGNPEEFVREQYLKTLGESDILPGTEPLETRMKQMVNLNMRHFMQTLLDRTDRMSSACGLQVRVPFCDVRIAEYLYGVPWEYKDYKGREKGLLRYAVKGLLPEPVRIRKKCPYPKTYDPAYLKFMESGLKTLLDHKNAPIWTILNKKAVQDLQIDWDQTPWYGQLMKRPQTIAYLLQTNFWMEHYQIQLRF